MSPHVDNLLLDTADADRAEHLEEEIDGSVVYFDPLDDVLDIRLTCPMVQELEYHGRRVVGSLKYTSLEHGGVLLLRSAPLTNPNIATRVRKLLTVGVHAQFELLLRVAAVLLRRNQTLLDQPLGELGGRLHEEGLHLRVKLSPLPGQVVCHLLWPRAHRECRELPCFVAVGGPAVISGEINHCGLPDSSDATVLGKNG